MYVLTWYTGFVAPSDSMEMAFDPLGTGHVPKFIHICLYGHVLDLQPESLCPRTQQFVIFGGLMSSSIPNIALRPEIRNIVTYEWHALNETCNSRGDGLPDVSSSDLPYP